MPRNISDTQGVPEVNATPPEVDKAEDETRTQKPKGKKGKVVLITVLVALVCAAGVFSYFYFGTPSSAYSQDNVAQIMDDGTIYPGVIVLGVDLSGKTPEEAKAEVEQAAQQTLADLSYDYSVENETLTLDATQLGASMDIDAALLQAERFGREGSFFDRQAAIEGAAQNSYVIDVPITYDQTAIASAVGQQTQPFTVQPQDATVVMDKISDEANKKTGMDISYAEGVTGKEVNTEKLSADIYETVQSGEFAPMAAEITTVEPTTTVEELKQLYSERGVYQTSFGDSAEGRRYNIWKMSNIINGVEIQPGETWSINDTAGPRTYANGWQGAPGINNGEYKTEAGGGICQVSSTLYNAVIRAELEIVDKTPHSWPLGYVDGGLDATISTGSPDFKFKNNCDVPVYIIAECDGDGARTVKISIYGPAYEDGLTRDFTSEKTAEWGAGAAITVADPSLPAGKTEPIIQAHNGKTFEITKHYLDADGNIVKSEFYENVTYSAKAAKVRVGTGAAAVDPAVTPTPDPGAATPTPDPGTATPTPDPGTATPTPDPGATTPDPGATTPDPGAADPTATASDPGSEAA